MPDPSTAPDCDPAPGSAVRRGRLQRALGLLLRLALTALAVAWVLHQVPLSEAGATLARAPWWVFVLPALLLVVNSFLHALRLLVLLPGPVSFRPISLRRAPRLFAALLQGSFLGAVLPTGGAELAKVGFLAPVVGSAELALAAVVVARLLELLPWTLLLLWGLAWGMWWRDPPLALAAVLFAVAFSCAMAAALLLARLGTAWLQRLPPGLQRLSSRAPARLRRVADRLATAFALVGRDPRRLLASLLLTLPFSLINCLAVWVVMVGHGLSLSYADALALVPTVDTVLALPITIGGLGLREGLFVHALGPFGATQAAAVSIGLTRWIGELLRAAVGGVVFLARGPSTSP